MIVRGLPLRQPTFRMADNDCWLGLDCGTGGTRALLVGAAGEVRAACSAAHAPIAMPRPLWAEQSPEDWWRAAQEAIRQVLRDTPAEAVRGVGLSGQMHGVVLLDERGATLGPAIIWCDQRAQEQAERLTAAIGAARVVELTANPLLVSFSAPKLAWLRENRPDDFRRARRFLLPKDYIRYRLTGEYATDLADASGTGLLDVAHRRWSEPMRAALGLPAGFLPSLHEGPEITGRLHAEAAAATGLRAGTPVVAGGGDQAAGAVGTGAVRAGLVAATIGTSGVIFAATGEPRVDARGRVHTFCHAVPDTWHVMGVTQAAGLSLRWLRDQLDCDGAGDDAYERLCAEAAAVAAGAEGLLFLPYLMGERSPHLDPWARGGWIGLTARHTRAHMIRAVLEGVAFSLKDCFAVLREMGLRPREAVLAGGGARGEVWPRIQADVYELDCARLRTAEGAAYGAALLAMTGTGRYPSVPAACDATLETANRFQPRAENAAVYARAYEVFDLLYARLADVFPRLARLSP